MCGRGPRSTLRVLKYGLAVTEMAVSDVPTSPNAIYAVKRDIHGKNKIDLNNKWEKFLAKKIILGLEEILYIVNLIGFSQTE